MEKEPFSPCGFVVFSLLLRIDKTIQVKGCFIDKAQRPFKLERTNKERRFLI
jgi:hypothetical protein